MFHLAEILIFVIKSKLLLKQISAQLLCKSQDTGIFLRPNNMAAMIKKDPDILLRCT